MSDLVAELTAFMARYERANNSHDIVRVAPMIDADATYWFSDGSHRGIGEIAAAIERTFSTIHNEVYEIRDLDWVVTAPRAARPRICLNERRATLTEIAYDHTL